MAVCRARFKETYQAFRKQFASEDEFAEYLSRLRGDAVKLLLKTGSYYCVSKEKVRNSFVKLIMIISIIETLISHDKPYEQLHDWLLHTIKHEEIQLPDSKRSFKRIIGSLIERYHDTYGIQRGVRRFFSDFLTNQQKIEMVIAFQRKRDYIERFSVHSENKRPEDIKISLEEFASQSGHSIVEGSLPICYDWRTCWIEYGHCSPLKLPVEWCNTLADPEKLQKALSNVIGIIYSYRSHFVHNSRFPAIYDRPKMDGVLAGTSVLDYFIDELLHIRDFSIEDFEAVFEDAYFKWFQQSGLR